MPSLLRSTLLAATAAAIVLTAPGASAFTLGRSLKSFEDERQIAVSQHAQIVDQFGGEYDDPDLAAYVDRVGQRVVANSDMAGLPFRFTVLNSPIVNAFTIGGGHVYVTRGILAAMNSEAELAALLGHEIAHVTERHSAQREARMKQDRAVSIGVGLLSGSLRAAVLADLLGNVSRSDYSRSQEEDADRIGARDMTKAGYDPYGMTDMLQVLEREVALSEKMSGGQGGIGLPSWLQSHPQTSDRIRDTLTQAEETGIARGTREVGRESHLSAIDGMLHGNDPRTGVVRDGRYVHTGLGFAFDLPEGWQLINQLGLVVGVKNESELFLFAGAEWPEDRPLEEFAVSAWYSVTEGGAGSLDSIAETEINGLDAVVATKQIRRLGMTANLASVAFRTSPSTVYGFSFAATGAMTEARIAEYTAIAEGFSVLSADEVAAIKPYRVKVITAGSLDTVDSLAERSVYTDFAVDRFRSLNGLDGEVAVGDRLKLIVEE